MKKTYIILAVILLICLIPVTAMADAPGYSPYNNYLLIDDYSNITSAEIWGYDKDNNYELIDKIIHPEETRALKQKLEFFYNEEGRFKNFQLVIAFNNGEKVSSNFVDILECGSYIYTVKDNNLKEGEITTQKVSGFSLFFGIFTLILPLLFTVLVEWITSLLFKLKPGKYVVIINLITNSILNILLLMLVNLFVSYVLLLAILEVFVAGAEFWFYTWKYKGYSKKRLLLFTVIANIASFGLYWLLTSWLI